MQSGKKNIHLNKEFYRNTWLDMSESHQAACFYFRLQARQFVCYFCKRRETVHMCDVLKLKEAQSEMCAVPHPDNELSGPSLKDSKSTANLRVYAFNCRLKISPVWDTVESDSFPFTVDYLCNTSIKCKNCSDLLWVWNPYESLLKQKRMTVGNVQRYRSTGKDNLAFYLKVTLLQ